MPVARSYRTRTHRRRRAAVAGAALLVLVAGYALTRPAGRAAPARAGAAPSTAPSRSAGPRHLVISAEPWSLAVPLSREVVLPDGGRLLVIGGLTAGNVSATGVVLIDPGTGHASPAGTLAVAAHDAAGALVAGRPVLFGGGGARELDTVQALGAGTASVIGHLPEPRSDLEAVTVGATTYLLGGYTGARQPSSVLATTDGVSFRDVAQLPVPVRYAAVAYYDGAIWLLGGELNGALVDDVQRIDPATGRASVVGHLPAPLDGATALVLGNRLYLAGGADAAGSTATVYRVVPGAGGVALRAAGRLADRTAFAGSAVLGSTGYLLGGEAPATLGAVQALTLAG